MLTRFDEKQVDSLFALISEAAVLRAQLEDIYQAAVVLLGEDKCRDSEEEWAHEAIYIYTGE